MKTYKTAGDIKCAVIGYGAAFEMGRQHLSEMRAAGMVPTAVADPDASRLAVARQEFPGIRTYGSATRMLGESDADLVAVITPHNTHARLALQCLRAGCHVVCEKPFAITTAECNAMISEAKKRKLLVTAFHNRHWDGCILEAVDRVREQRVIGDLVRVDVHMSGFRRPGKTWRASKSRSGGILHDWGVHLLEYSLQVIDSDIVDVSGFTKSGVHAKNSVWKDDTIEDDALAVVRFRSGVWLTLHMSSINPNPDPGWVNFYGTAGVYLMQHNTYEIVKGGRKEIVRKLGNNRAGRGSDFYQNVADHLVKGEKLVITPEWSRRPIHILDLAYRSARKGAAMKAKYR